MLNELDNSFKGKKGMLVSNIYTDFISKELGNKLDIKCAKNFKEFIEDLDNADTYYDYLVIIHDKDSHTDEDNLIRWDEVVYHVLYEKVIILCDGTILSDVDLNIDTKLIEFNKGFKFNDIVRTIKECYKDTLESEDTGEGEEFIEPVLDSYEEEKGYEYETYEIEEDIPDSKESSNEDELKELEDEFSELDKELESIDYSEDELDVELEDEDNSEDLESEDDFNDFDMFEDIEVVEEKKGGE